MIFGNYFKIYRGFLNARKNLETFSRLPPHEKLKGNSLLNFKCAQDYAYLEILGRTDCLYNFPVRYSLEEFFIASKKIESFLEKVNMGLFEEAVNEYD